MQFTIPLSEVIMDFYDKLKQLTSGYARYSPNSYVNVIKYSLLFSFEYEEAGYQKADLVKVNSHLASSS